jgi:hypothetical protein
MTTHLSALADYTPYSRVAALDQLARKTLHELRVSSLATHPNFLSGVLASFRQTRQRYFPREALDELKAATVEDSIDYGFDERIRINEIGKLLEGQEDHVRRFSLSHQENKADLIRPATVPRFPPSRRPSRLLRLG